MTKRYIALLGIMLAVLVVALWTYSRATGDVITVCVKKDGLMHMIGQGFKRADCKDNEQLISWNMQGPQGEPGPKGDKGDPGPQGPAGASLHLFDGNGQNLGVLTYGGDIGHSVGSSANTYATYLSTPGVFITFRQGRDSVVFNPTNPSFVDVYFTELDCTGKTFTTGIKPMELFAAKGGGYVIWTGNVNPSSSMLSKSQKTLNGCENTKSLPDPLNQVLVQYVALPFSLPIAFPLEVRAVE